MNKDKEQLRTEYDRDQKAVIVVVWITVAVGMIYSFFEALEKVGA